MFRKIAITVTAAVAILTGATANADLIWTWDSGDGLSARANVSMLDSKTLQIVVENTSTALPAWMPIDSSNQFLTSISFDLLPGISIVGGSATLGQGARTINFDKVSSQLTGGADVSGEWGFGNTGYRMGLSRNFITTNQAQAAQFGGVNLDGPANLSGPQGGLISTPAVTSLGGLGGIQGPVIFQIQLSGDMGLSYITPGNIEFGSDAAFVAAGVAVPEPATMAMLALGGLAMAGGHVLRRRRTVKRSA